VRITYSLLLLHATIGIHPETHTTYSQTSTRIIQASQTRNQTKTSKIKKKNMQTLASLTWKREPQWRRALTEVHHSTTTA